MCRFLFVGYLMVKKGHLSSLLHRFSSILFTTCHLKITPPITVSYYEEKLYRNSKFCCKQNWPSESRLWNSELMEKNTIKKIYYSMHVHILLSFTLKIWRGKWKINETNSLKMHKQRNILVRLCSRMSYFAITRKKLK